LGNQVVRLRITNPAAADKEDEACGQLVAAADEESSCKVVLSLINKRYVMNTYGEVAVQIHVFFISALDGG
jgi:hypothetical protein